MKYRFSHYILDTKTSELSGPDGSTLLKQKPFLLLLCLVKNPQQLLSKDFLLKEVWNDRLVSDNTIAQTVGQLRQLIEIDSKNPEFIVTHRGRGISFSPAVEIINSETNNGETPTDIAVTDESIPGQISANKPPSRKTKPAWLAVLFVVLAVSAAAWYMKTQGTEPEAVINVSAPNLLILTVQDADNIAASEKWLHDSVSEVFSGLLDQEYNGKVSAEQLTPETDINEYLNSQWSINPNLSVVTTDLIKNDLGYDLSLNFTNDKQLSESQSFSGTSINAVMYAASGWLAEELHTQAPELTTYLPDDTIAAELYMRGVAATNNSEYEKASQYLELALTERPDFNLARLQLAEVKKNQGEFDEALILLDTLEKTPLYPQVELQAVVTRGFIYDVQSRLDEAKILFEQTLDNYALAPPHRLNPVRFELSYILTSLNLLDQALHQLDQIEQTTPLASDPLLYADTLQKKASIYQSLGQTSDALNRAEQALSIYLKLGKLLGAAKTHNLLARIYTLKSDYKQAKYHLFETLNITRKMDYKLGVGAAINELVFILLREGDFDQAGQLIDEMQSIAVEIGYTHMVIGAKQHATTLAIHRHDWQLAEQYLEQQIDLANSSSNQTALMSSNFLKLEYLISKGSTAGAQDLIDWLDERIDPSKNLRQHVALELDRAKLLRLEGQQLAAIGLFNSVKELAKEIQDNQSLVQANNNLAEIYLDEQPEKALAVIKENESLNPVAYPYLLILSKALRANGQTDLSLQAAIECKNSAGQLWQREDEAYLSQLALLNNPESSPGNKT